APAPPPAGASEAACRPAATGCSSTAAGCSGTGTASARAWAERTARRQGKRQGKKKGKRKGKRKGSQRGPVSNAALTTESTASNAGLKGSTTILGPAFLRFSTAVSAQFVELRLTGISALRIDESPA